MLLKDIFDSVTTLSTDLSSNKQTYAFGLDSPEALKELYNEETDRMTIAFVEHLLET